MSEAFESRSNVNGNMLRQFAGQNVSIMLCVDDNTGTNLAATSTDEQKITVSVPDSVAASRGDWVEVIGKPTGPTVIKAKEVILFGGDNIDFDKDGYNMMVHFVNNCKEIFRSG